MKLLLYCTKAKPYIMKYKDGKYKEIASFYNKQDLVTYNLLNGKIAAECDYEVEEIEHYIHYEPEVNVGIAVLPEFECDAYCTKTLDHFKLLEKSCLNELDNYLKGKNGYAIHIKNLHIFDEPKELQEYATLKRYAGGYEKFASVGTAPQNMMYVYDVNSDNPSEKKVLISIRPEWLCKILNKEKTIEVRRKVLKEMLK